MRNINGYLRDCKKHNLAPSPFQMILFMYDADMVLTPPFWVPIWLLMGLHHLLAFWVGGRILG